MAAASAIASRTEVANNEPELQKEDGDAQTEMRMASRKRSPRRVDGLAIESECAAQ